MALYLLVIAIVMFACVLMNKATGKVGIPMLLAFILLGMFFGSDGIVKIPFDNYIYAEQVCSVALVFIMFYGGFGTNWKEAKSVAPHALLLSSAGVVITAGLAGAFCHFVFKAGWAESFLFGAVIGSTDAASVFSILRSKRLNLKYNTASILELESGSNDPFAYMLTLIILSVMNVNSAPGSILYMVFKQLFFGAAFGLAIAAVSACLLKKIKFSTAGFNEIFVTAAAILSYAAPTLLGGSGYLSAYIVGIVLGNSDIGNKKTLVPFFDGVTGMMQMLLFFLLGLLSFPSKLISVLPISAAFALFLTFAARPAVIFMLLAPFKCKLNQMLVISWAGFRGASSIVFTVMAVMSAETENDIFHIVLGVVMFSILIQGSLLPYVSKRLNMIDSGADVMKTFSDYSEEIPVQFIQFTIKEDHSWCGMALKDIFLPPDTLVVLLQRESEKLVPKGSTVLRKGDILILCAKYPGNIEGISLTESTVTSKSKYCGKRIREVSSDKENFLIVLIMRNESVIIPNGNTMLRSGDLLVIMRN